MKMTSQLWLIPFDQNFREINQQVLGSPLP